MPAECSHGGDGLERLHGKTVGGAMGVFEESLFQAMRPLIDRLARIEDRIASLDEAVSDRVPEPERLWTTAQVAKKCGVTPSAIRVWQHRGQISTVKQGRRVLVPDTQVRELIANGGRPANCRA